MRRQLQFTTATAYNPNAYLFSPINDVHRLIDKTLQKSSLDVIVCIISSRLLLCGVLSMLVV